MIQLTGIRAVAWDMDGTILDSFGILQAVTAEVCAEMGREVPDAETFRVNFHGSLEDSLKSILDLATDRELEEVMGHFLRLQTKHYDSLDGHLYDDALGLSEHAAQLGIPQIVITNRSHGNRGTASPRSIVARSVLGERIDEIRCGDEGAYQKPDPRVLDGWLEKHGVRPAELLIVGDQVVDVQLALALGAQGILIQRGTDSLYRQEILPDGWQKSVQTVSSLADIRLT